MKPLLSLVLSGIISYLLGSLSPAYLFGRILRGIDIRDVNYRNAGTRNVKKTLGLWPAIATAVIDTTKGIGAMVFAERVLNLTGYMLLIPVVGAVAGHVFPFYMSFRGGRGTATAIGMVLFMMGRQLANGSFPVIVFAALLIVSGMVYFVSRSGDATAIAAFTAMLVTVLAEFEPLSIRVVAAVPVAFMLIHAIFRGGELGLYTRPLCKEFIGWRVFLRPAAILFIPLHIVMPPVLFIILVSVLPGIALVLDVLRIVSRRRMNGVYKEKELERISSITFFLISILMLFVLFESLIAYLALAYLVFGDLSGKLFGLRFGQTVIAAGRTVEGSVGFLTGALIAGYTVSVVFNGPDLVYILVGAVAATLIELLTIGVDDNLTVALGTAGILYLLI